MGYDNIIHIYSDDANTFSNHAQLKGGFFMDNKTDVVIDRCGFLYNTTGNPQVGNATMQICDVNSDGTFEAQISNLNEKTVYYYTAFVTVNGINYYEEPDYRTKSTKSLFTIDIECFVHRCNCCIAWAHNSYAKAEHLGYNDNYLSQMWEAWGWAGNLGLNICEDASYYGLKAYEYYLEYLPIEQQIYNWAVLFYPNLAGIDPEDGYNQCVHSKSDD